MRRYLKICEDMLCHATPYAPKSAPVCVCANSQGHILEPYQGNPYPVGKYLSSISTQSNPSQCTHFGFELPASQPAASTASLSFGPPPIHLSTLLDLRSHLFGHSSEVLSPFPPRTYLRIRLHLASSANTPRLSFTVQITPDTS